MAVTYSKQAAKKLAKMGRKDRSRLLSAIEKLASGKGGDIKLLSGSDGIYRLRIGDWRVIYSADGTILLILRIAARGGVYKD